MLALAISGCGGDSGKTGGKPSAAPSAPATGSASAGKTPDQIFSEAVAAFKSAKSVRVTGWLSDGKEAGRIDMLVAGANAKGTISVPVGGKQAPAQIVKLGDRLYLKGRKFWTLTAGAQAGAVMGDRWVLAPKKTNAELASFTTLDGLAKILVPEGTVTRGKDSTYKGKPVLVLKDGSGSPLLIAAQGAPYPLRIADAKNRRNVLNLTYGAAPAIKAPSGSVLDLSKRG